MAGTSLRVDAPPVGVPRLWPGETIVCIASGPSLTREDVNYVRGKARVMAVNASLLLAPWADVFHASDARIGMWHADAVHSFQGLKFSMERDLEHDYGATLLKNAGIWGLSLNPDAICNGRNSGYQAVNVAVLLGASRIVLLGYDMQPGPNGESHWHGDHPNNFNPADLVYRSWVAAFKSIVQPLVDLGVSVVNCTKRSALTMFPMADVRETL